MRIRVTRPFRDALTGEERRRGDELDVTAPVGRGLISMRYAEPIGDLPPEEPEARDEPGHTADPVALGQGIDDAETSESSKHTGKRRRKK